MALQLIKRSDKAGGFKVLPAGGWLSGPRLARPLPLAKDVETSIASAETRIIVAHIRHHHYSA